MSSKVTIGIFDDHPILGVGLKAMLIEHSHLSIEFIALNREQLESELTANPPMILFCDVVAPDVEGLELFKHLSEKHPDVAVIAYTTLNSAVLVENLLALGVSGFLNKRQPEAQVVAAIQTVCEGARSVPKQFDFLLGHAASKEAIELSDREKQILGEIISGKLTKEIAFELNISKNTVEDHRANLFRKLEVQNVAELLKKAMELGYIS